MIAAVLLAAGESKRMGTPKLALPWRDGRSMIASVVNTFGEAGASPMVVVTGGGREAVERSLAAVDVTLTYNADYARGEMLSSIKVGLRALDDESIEAAMICPGDLPFLQASTVRAIMQMYGRTSSRILTPSYRGRRGHPVLVKRDLWTQILALKDDMTLRDWLHQREALIEYLTTEDPGVVKDIDTPEDYPPASERHE